MFRVRPRHADCNDCVPCQQFCDAFAINFRFDPTAITCTTWCSDAKGSVPRDHIDRMSILNPITYRMNGKSISTCAKVLAWGVLLTVCTEACGQADPLPQPTTDSKTRFYDEHGGGLPASSNLESVSPLYEKPTDEVGSWAGASNRTSIRSGAAGNRAVTSIRSIKFERPRDAVQSAASRSPRTSSVCSTVNWVNPRAVHRTLFFNDNPLEREGKTNFPCLQPAVSVLRFGTDALTFPAKRLSPTRCGNCLHYATSPR